MQAEPVYGAYQSVVEKIGYKPRVIYMTPQGKVFNQSMVEELAKEENLVASDEDVDAEIEKMASMYGMEVEKLKGLMGDNEKDSIKRDIAIQKAVEFVMANVKERAKAKSKSEDADAE